MLDSVRHDGALQQLLNQRRPNGEHLPYPVPTVACDKRWVQVRQEVWGVKADHHGREHTARIRQVGQAHVGGFEVGDLTADVVHEEVEWGDDSDA